MIRSARLAAAGLAAAGLGLLAACTLEPPPGPPSGPLPPEPAPDACGAADLQGLVGQPAAVLAAMTFPAPTRVIRPGMAVTMDYRADRLNIEVNAAELIARVTCG
jgi:hypothetical protein